MCVTDLQFKTNQQILRVKIKWQLSTAWSLLKLILYLIVSHIEESNFVYECLPRDIRFKAKFSEIWSFVERKLKSTIPSYIKYVLKYCGYENCHTIATIEDNDLEYFVGEVRKRGITNFFSGKFGIINALQGSNKSEENFEFSRGQG